MKVREVRSWKYGTRGSLAAIATVCTSGPSLPITAHAATHIRPTTMAEIENRKKNEEPSVPNCSASSFISVMIGTPARPTTILSAKFTSMNRNSRNVIFHAPLGVGCAVKLASPFVDLTSAFPEASHGVPGKATAHFY